MADTPPTDGKGERTARGHAPGRIARETDQRRLIKGARPGSDYLRIRAPAIQTLHWGGGVLEAEPRTTLDQTTEHQPAVERAAPADGAPDGEPAPRPAPRPQQERATPRPIAKTGPDDDITLPGLGRRVTLRGSRIGDTYIRRELPRSGGFRTRGENVLEATEQTLLPSSPVGRGAERIKRILIGQRLATAEQINERLTKVKALAVLSSDAISSVAYATEASLGILIAAGIGALHLNLPIAGCIILLMIIVGTSYWQTIHAYPHGGGSYIVARDNLGDLPGLIAAAALLIDYVLTVSVSVSSGVDALVTAVKPLATYSVELGVFFIFVIMVVNLRGIRESGTIFAAPTYLFIGSFLIMILTGVIHAALSPGGLFHAITPTTPPEALGWAPEKLGLVLILTAFASGCSAMTGVEAISNGVPAFKRPEAHNAARTLIWMVATLVILYAGITFLAWRFGIEPNPQQNPTVDGQIAQVLFNGPFVWFFYVIQIATLLILVLAANTSFADFPRLSSILARDGFLPHQFSFRGDRLAFTTGIIVLGVLSGVLLVVFKGSTDALINLYALGVFTAFTLSQSGMVVRWWRLRERGGAGWQRSLVINAVGAVTTAIVAAVIIFTKFDRGAWIVVLLVPLLVLMFRAISSHYQHVRRETIPLTPMHAEQLRHIMVVPVADLNRPAVQSLAYARSLAQHVIALHVSLDDEDEAEFRADWDRWVEHRQQELAREAAETRDGAEAVPARRAQAIMERQPQLVVIKSPYRSLVAPLMAYINALRDANPQSTVSVILPEFVPEHWWERLLHNQSALRLKLALYSDPGVVVVNVPHHLRR